MEQDIHFKALEGDARKSLGFGVLKTTLLVSHSDACKSGDTRSCCERSAKKPLSLSLTPPRSIIQKKSPASLPAAARKRVAARLRRPVWYEAAHTRTRLCFKTRPSCDSSLCGRLWPEIGRKEIPLYKNCRKSVIISLQHRFHPSRKTGRGKGLQRGGRRFFSQYDGFDSRYLFSHASFPLVSEGRLGMGKRRKKGFHE